MFISTDDVGAMIRRLWKHAKTIPGGKRIFSLFVGKFAPYSGTIGAIVEDLDQGYARMTLRERGAVRNHLKSVHAMALANFAEICSGLGLMYSLPSGTRGILLGFRIDYKVKARGVLTAETRFTPPTNNLAQDYSVFVTIKNAESTVVAQAEAIWRLGPVPPKTLH